MANKHTKKHNFDCVVNLTRMTEREYGIYSKSSVIISKQFNIKIKDNYLEIKGMKQHSSSNTFAISFRKQMNEFLLENMTDTPPPTSVPATASNTESALNLKTNRKADTAKTLNNLINDAWKVCKRDYLALNKQPEIGDIVMAKMKSYSAWPDRVHGFTKDKKRVQIYFFGTHYTGSVDAKETVAFHHSESVIRLLLLRMVGPFHKGISEIEAILGISHEHSLLRERNALE